MFCYNLFWKLVVDYRDVEGDNVDKEWPRDG